jgi:heptosyltransferase-2
MKKSKLLVVATHGLGDVIMTVRLVNLILCKYDVSILVTGNVEKEISQAILAKPSVKFIILNNLGKNKIFKFLRLIRIIYKENFDLSISQYGVNQFLYGLITFFGMVKLRIGWGSNILTGPNFEIGKGHKVYETKKVLDYLGVNLSLESLKKQPIYSSFKLPTKKVVLGPGSFLAEKHKRWPIDNYANLTNLLVTKHNILIDIIGSKDEEVYCDRIIEKIKHQNVRNLCGKTSISQSLDVIKSASLVVSNCNGISHMASIVDVDILCLYGPTNHNITGPFTEKLSVISANLDCSPCYKRGFTSGCGKPICMESISVYKVYKRCLEILGIYEK